MSDRTYSPDKWVILEMDMDGKKCQKILAGWAGGYLDGDSWKLSSGTTSVEEEGGYYIFHQHSGSTYKCHKNMEGLTALTGVMLAKWQKDIEENEDWSIKVIEKDKEESE